MILTGCFTLGGTAGTGSFGSSAGGAGGEENHAWNAVRIEGAWYLVDVTWDSGSLSSSGNFIPEYDTSYLFISPRPLIYTHFPAMTIPML
mgnify:CR=1|jgi:transglutaminase/protease-like cytokinesis protein 3